MANILDTDVYWLITGESDPNRLTLAARHEYDHETRQHSVPSRDADERTLRDLHTAYRQAFQLHASPEPLPKSAAQMHDILGKEFARPFIQRIETHLGIDVIRMAELGTAYSFTSTGRRVIAIPATGNWFRENWSLAHELGHLSGNQSETEANAFAAELLLPREAMKQIDWQAISIDRLADFVWRSGVSTDALLRRLSAVGASTPAHVTAALSQTTQRLLRRDWHEGSKTLDLITQRTEQASTRRFPLALQEAHQDAIAAGRIGPAYLAWMLGVDAETLELDAPPVADPTLERVDELAAALGLSLT